MHDRVEKTMPRRGRVYRAGYQEGISQAEAYRGEKGGTGGAEKGAAKGGAKKELPEAPGGNPGPEEAVSERAPGAAERILQGVSEMEEGM